MQRGKWCEPQKFMEYDTIMKAKKECLQDNCTMFYDFKSEGNKFVLCPPNAEIKYSLINSKIYVKGKTPLQIFLFSYFI